MVIYFELRGVGKRPDSRPCLFDDCYLCPMQSCREYSTGVVRAVCKDAATLETLRRKNPRTMKILKIIKGEK